MATSSSGFGMHGVLMLELASTTFVEHYYSLLCWGCLGASSLATTGECEMIWLSLVENSVYVAVILGFVQIAIYLALSVCGLIVPHVLRAVQVQQLSVDV